MNRRDFLKATPVAAAALSPLAAQSKRPNIVLIMADDMGFSDIGCYGSEIATPNLDGLARNGVRFTQFYNTARCCPTRASLLTGLYPHQAGIGHMINDLGKPAYQGYLNDRSMTIAEVMRGSGYRTAMAGKWHVGENRPHWPTDRGFERYFGLISGASNFWRLDQGRKMADGDKPFTPPTDGSFYMTDAFTDHAVKYIDEFGRGPAPFFLYLAYTSPHWPLHAPESDVAKYQGRYLKGWDELRRERHQRMIEMGIVDRRWALTPRDDDAAPWASIQDKKLHDRNMAVYAAQIDRMDQGIGRVLNAVRRAGAWDNTLILFLADNGGCAEIVDRGVPGVPAGGPDSFLSYGIPWANASNTPFRLYKHWVHEGGISSPLIAHWPAGIARKNAITHEPAHLIDLMATCSDVGQAAYPATFQGRPVTPKEGTSLAPAFAGKPLDPRRIYWEHEGNRAVRDGKWKLVSRHPGDWELYDIEADRTELNNLAGAESSRVRAMAADWSQWAGRCGVETWGQLPGQRQRKGKKKA